MVPLFLDFIEFSIGLILVRESSLTVTSILFMFSGFSMALAQAFVWVSFRLVHERLLIDVSLTRALEQNLVQEGREHRSEDVL